METSAWEPEGAERLIMPDGQPSDEAALADLDLPGLYRAMLAARTLDLRAARLGLPAFAPAAGEESVVAAVAAVAAAGEWVFPGPRDRALALLRGADPVDVARQLLSHTGASTGGVLPPGQLASAAHHVAPPARRLAMHLPLAAGLARARLGTRRATFAILGEGSTTVGAFHEALALAAAGNLPLVVLCKSMVWPDGAPVEAGLVGDPVADRARAMGLWSRRVDGADVAAVARRLGEAARRAREGGGPALLEVVVSPLLRDPPPEADPIERLRRHLDRAGQWTQTFQDVAEAEVRSALDRALRALEDERQDAGGDQ